MQEVIGYAPGDDMEFYFNEIGVSAEPCYIIGYYMNKVINAILPKYKNGNEVLVNVNPILIRYPMNFGEPIFIPVFV